MRAFALTIWKCRLATLILKHAAIPVALRQTWDGPSEYWKRQARLLAVYHAHERQLYQDISPVAVMHRRFKVATSLPQIKLGTQEKMLCDYIQERCVGRIISLSEHDEGMVPDPSGAAVVPYVYDPNTLVVAALEAGAALSGCSLAEPLGLDHRHHVFFNVLRGDLHRRFNVLSDDTKQWQLAVKHLQLCGRASGAGIFRSGGRVEYLDIRQILATKTVQQFLTDLMVWKTHRTSWLRIRDLAASSSTAALLSLSHGGTALQLTVHHSMARLEQVVQKLLEAKVGRFWFDAIGEKLMGDGGALSVEVDATMLQSMLYYCVLLKQVSEFEDEEYVVNDKALQWLETLDLHSGSKHPTCIFRSDPSLVRAATKLSLMMCLVVGGWQSNALIDIHTPTSAKLCRHNLSKSRWYYVALVEADKIFSRWSRWQMADDDLESPFISHTRTEPYYKAFPFFFVDLQ